MCGGAMPTKISLQNIRKGFDAEKGRLEVIDDLNFDRKLYLTS